MKNKYYFILPLALVGVLLAANGCFGTQLQDLCKEKVATAGDSAVVSGLDGWFFLKEELQHVAGGTFWGPEAAAASRTKKKKYADPLPEIVAYNSKLKEKGITLYLMPIPPKVLVYPEKLDAGLMGKVGEDISLYDQFFSELEKNGVKSINLLPVFQEHKDLVQLYCKTDTHYSGEGLALVADTAAALIKNEPWFQDIPKGNYGSSSQKVKIHGDLLQMAGQKGEEELTLGLITRKDSGEPVQDNRQSPVILLGDSHTLVFSAGGDLHAKGAGLFDHLSAGLGFPVDLLGVRGSGVTPARIQLYQRSKKDPGYLQGKKVFIWCFTAREFTGSGGFKKIPVAPK